MSYVSLYRKYRPQSFDDVVGQAHVTRTLRNAIDEDRLSHAYLFTGPRGTGKTSTARILAKAINCEQGPTSSPCGNCTHCLAITEGNSVDVIELDMASHGGVDDARELRDRALFAPASARRKVYILDEVHMASTAAFNALLKLIEEPPSHVLFAMATTDPQKVLPTIMSRVQRLDLRRVDADALADHVRDLCGREGYAIDDGAVDAVVRAGDGSVRDTLSVLEQVLAFAGREVTAEAVAQTLGQTPVEQVLQTVDLLAERDLAGLLAVVQDLLDDGHDLRRFTLDLAQHVRDLLVLQVAPDRPDLVDATDERRRRLQDQAAVLPRATLLRVVDRLAATVTEQRQGSPRLPLELALAQLTTPGADGDLAELADRVARLEAGGAPTTSPSASRPTRWSSTPEPAPPPDAGPPGDEPADDAPTPPRAQDIVADDPPEAAAPEAPPETSTSEASEASETSVATPASEVSEEAVPEAVAGSAASVAPEADTSEAPVGSADGDASDGLAVEVAAVEDDDAGEGAPATQAGAGEGAPATQDAASESVTAAQDDAVDGAAAAEDDPSVKGDAPTAPTAAATGGATSDLDVVRAHWDGVLEIIKQGSRRHHAMLEPATPVGVSQGILTLRYGRRHASFHAVQARRGELDSALRAAVERTCGMRLRIDVKVEGEDERRRPMPPSVTPDDARTPVLDDHPQRAPVGTAVPEDPPTAAVAPTTPAASAAPRGPAASPVHAGAGSGVEVDEGADVREAELEDGAPAQVDVDELLATELNAQLVEEQPPPESTG